ncbi:MAG: putative heme-binding protein, partial [Verrucomicrobiales bacterium]|nr:putative heme-binding protein [Verrucomicrobiales bacterium]
GGGSPTGALFLDEPGFPDQLGHGLYTCQWGWNNVTRHPLQRKGATFTADKETFLRIPRPTGIATDGLGNLYVASWKGATFSYEGTNAGFVVRAAPLNNEAAPFPNLHTKSDKQLIALLSSPSATQRFHVQREILQRSKKTDFAKRLGELASSSKSLSVRAAAVFTLGQIENTSGADMLLKLCNQPVLKEFALRALADSKVIETKVLSKVFIEALEDKNSAVRLQAIIALNRLHKTEIAERLFPFVADADPAIAHAAFRALVSFRAADVCFKFLDSNDASAVKSALRILGNLPETSVVDGLIKRLNASPAAKSQILETLCRLYFREADWDGSWWTTRPDTSGPYYKPVSWEATEHIRATLQQELSLNNPRETRLLLMHFQKYKIEFPGIPSSAFELLITDSTIQPAWRKKAFQTVTRISNAAAIHALLASDPKEKFTIELREEFVRDRERSKDVEEFVKLAKTAPEKESELAYTVLLHIANQTNVAVAVKTSVEQAITEAPDSPALRRAKAAVPQRDLPASDRSTHQTVAKVPYDELLKRVTAASGDAKIGAKLFETVGCVKCHTVGKNEAPKGPFLGDITARYNKLEILESILRPSAKVAQGFETTTIESKDGESLDGFIVRESGDEIELRNIVGATVIQKKNIAVRGTRTSSMMPDGLTDHLAPEDLASLLRYLESLRASN